MKKALHVTLLSLLFTFTTGCDKAADPKLIAETGVVQPLDYGNGVFYFPVTEALFGKSLANFIEKNKNRDVVAMTGNGTGGHGFDRGYFVVTKEK